MNLQVESSVRGALTIVGDEVFVRLWYDGTLCPVVTRIRALLHLFAFVAFPLDLFLLDTNTNSIVSYC